MKSGSNTSSTESICYRIFHLKEDVQAKTKEVFASFGGVLSIH